MNKEIKAMSKKKICLTPSNQPENLYAAGNTNEKIQCGRIAEYTRKALERCGFEVLVLQDVSLSEKVRQSNKWGADLHIPIHTNAHNGKTTGTRMMAYDKGESYKACEAIYKHLAPYTPGKSENISLHPEFYEIKNTYAPCAYVEAEFHDVPATANWIINNAEGIGEAICRGVCDYFKVQYTLPEEVMKPASKELYRVQVGSFTVKKNAEDMLAKAKAAGFKDAFITTVKI